MQDNALSACQAVMLGAHERFGICQQAQLKAAHRNIHSRYTVPSMSIIVAGCAISECQVSPAHPACSEIHTATLTYASADTLLQGVIRQIS